MLDRAVRWTRGETVEVLDDEQERRRARRKLRYYERRLRAAKRVKAVALSRQAERKAEGRIRRLQAKVRTLVEETGVERQPQREQIGERRGV